ncbi:MAG: mechanosensitive ion channel, partial [Deltaproteobacteria bacterium]|nr:mechanosensitive ion channel [Deltaproteobacteria bacterium]
MIIDSSYPSRRFLPVLSRLFLLAATVLLCAALCAPGFAVAQGGGLLPKAGGDAGKAEQAPTAEPSIEEQIAEAREGLKGVEADLAAADRVGDAHAAELAARPDELEERRRLLGDLARSFSARISALDRKKEIAVRRAKLTAEAEAWQGFPEKPPYPIEFVDRIRQELLAVQLVLDSLDAEKLREEAARVLWEDRLAEAEPEVRRLTEALEGEKDQSKANRLQWLLDLAKLRVRSAGVGLNAANTSLEDIVARTEANSALLAFLRRKIEAARADSSFTKKELDEKLARIAKSRARIQADLDAAAKRQSRIGADLAEIRGSLEKLKAARAAGRAGPDTDARLEKTLETRETEYVTAALLMESLKNYLTGTNAEERIWKDRYAISQETDPAALTKVHRRNEVGFKDLNLWEHFFISRLELALTDISGQKRKLAGWKPADGDRAEAEAVLGFYEERLETLRQGLEEVNELKTLLNIWQAEIDERRHSVPITERALSFLKVAHGFARDFWGFELFTLEDTIVVEGEEIKGLRPITVAKVLQALLILGFGIWASSLIARAVHKVATSRFKAEENVAALLDKALFTILIVSVVLLAISFVQIPLTAFAFAGGALAIGLGFGAQNLINNFISGIILLLERPIKLGDIVDVEGIRGRVVHIGA